MKISTPKLKAILLYFGNNTDTRFLGKVKLMKLFYFLDFMHIKKYGSPVTYDRYVHLEHGPIPSAIKNLIDTAAEDIDHSMLADTIRFEKKPDFDMVKMLPNRAFTETDRKLFSETELDIMGEVCRKYGSKNTKYIEDASHDESPWLNTSPLAEIPYALAANDGDCFVDKEAIELLEKLF